MNAIQQMVVVVKHVQTILDRTNVHVELATSLVVTNMHVTVINGCSYSFVRRGRDNFSTNQISSLSTAKFPDANA